MSSYKSLKSSNFTNDTYSRPVFSSDENAHRYNVAPQQFHYAPTIGFPDPNKLDSKLIFIDSRDRDEETYPSASKFTINLEEAYQNIVAIGIVFANVPVPDTNTNQYVCLNIKAGGTELNKINSPSSVVQNSFAVLPLNVTGSGFNLSINRGDSSDQDEYTYFFNTPLKELSSLSITFHTRDGKDDLYDFGTEAFNILFRIQSSFNGISRINELQQISV